MKQRRYSSTDATDANLTVVSRLLLPSQLISNSEFAPESNLQINIHR